MKFKKYNPLNLKQNSRTAQVLLRINQWGKKFPNAHSILGNEEQFPLLNLTRYSISWQVRLT
jgi:hypothetical protein